MSGDPGMETPVAPLPAPESSSRRRTRMRDLPKAREVQGAPTFFTPFRSGLAYAFGAWRVVLCVLVVHLALALTVVMPFQARMAERLDGHAHGPALSGTPDAYDRAVGWEEGGLAAGVWIDAKRLEKPLLDSQKLTVFWIGIVAWLFGALVNGGYLGTMRTGERVTFGSFLEQGGRSFGRMLRVGIVFALAYYVLATAVMVVWAKAAEVNEVWSATSETKWWGDLIRFSVMIVAFLWMRVAADLARADLVRTGRRSALLAYLRGIGWTLRHPLRTFGLALFVGAPAFLLLIGLGILLGVVDSGGLWMLLLGFVVVQLAAFVRLAARAAVLTGSLVLLDQVSTRPA
ncbi:MAG: hypothetical protein QNJ98_13130 [Planctomycetota bacterium]|nr:hypothetical protein [Planctomycetota bacterium]